MTTNEPNVYGWYDEATMSGTYLGISRSVTPWWHNRITITREALDDARYSSGAFTRAMYESWLSSCDPHAGLDPDLRLPEGI